MRTIHALACLLLVLLAGCASGPLYRAAPTPNDYGYRDTALTDTQYRVRFAGGYGVAREIVDKLALFRAAELALEHGAPRFRLLSQDTAPVTSQTVPVTSIGYGYPFWGLGVGISRPITRTRYETVLKIQLGTAVPRQGPDVYDAAAVRRNLAPLAAEAAR